MAEPLRSHCGGRADRRGEIRLVVPFETLKGETLKGTGPFIDLRSRRERRVHGIRDNGTADTIERPAVAPPVAVDRKRQSPAACRRRPCTARNGDAVGTGIAARPPHRPVRTGLPHTVLTSEVDWQTAHSDTDGGFSASAASVWKAPRTCPMAVGGRVGCDGAAHGACTPMNASPCRLPDEPHHSGPRRLARSYLVRLFHSQISSGSRRRTLSPLPSPAA